MSPVDMMIKAAGSEQATMIIILVVLKVIAVLGLALAVRAALSPSRPDRRHLILRLSLMMALLLPALAAVMPPVEVNLFGSMLPVARNLPSIVIAATLVETPVSAGSGGWEWIDLVILIWLIGVTVVIARLARGLIIRSRILRESEPVESRALRDSIAEQASRMGILKPVRVAVSSKVTGPIAWSFPRPTIVMSSESATWSRHDSNLAITHELCHIRRKDDIWMLVGALATAAHWFNPLVWLARNRMILEADNACDGYVVNAGADADAYASFMVALARSCHAVGMPVLVGTEIVGRRQLEERIMLIQSGRTQSVRVKKSLVRLAWTLVIAVCIPLAATRITGSTASAETAKTPPAATAEKYPAPDSFVEVDSMPEALTMPSPVYPESAQKAGVEGRVWVQVLVDKEGKVADVRVHKSSGYEPLDSSALETARKATWKPAIQGGKPVAVWVLYEVMFKLSSKDTAARKLKQGSSK